MKNTPATLEEHRQYLYDIVRLKLFYLHLVLSENPTEGFAFALRNRVDIFRKTDLNPEGLNPAGEYFDTPEWLAFEKALFEIYSADLADRKKFEEEGFAMIRPHLDARVERDFRDRSALAGITCGFLRVMRPVVPAKPGVSIFHMVNTKKPDSFLDYPEFMKESLLALCDLAERFGAVKVGTSSWLNSVPRWLEWFPEEYRAGLSEPDLDVRWHYGFWGQFINARGCFNAAAGDHLRKTGRFPYYPRSGSCTIAALREHLLGRQEGTVRS